MQQLACLQLGMSPLESCGGPHDIWSAGVLLAEVATGTLPFPWESMLLLVGDDGKPAPPVSISNSPVCIQAVNAECVSLQCLASCALYLLAATVLSLLPGITFIMHELASVLSRLLRDSPSDNSHCHFGRHVVNFT